MFLTYRDEGKSLKNKMVQLETVFMTILWYRVQRFDITSKCLQKVDLDLVTGDNMLKSLVTFINNLRNEFNDIEEHAKILAILFKNIRTNQSKK